MTCEEILQTVRGFCAREGLLEGRRQIALAVSGGADSMALLCLMRPLAEENGITLTVCHVNHGLRGETADRDETFVREACARLGRMPAAPWRPVPRASRNSSVSA